MNCYALWLFSVSFFQFFFSSRDTITLLSFADLAMQHIFFALCLRSFEFIVSFNFNLIEQIVIRFAGNFSSHRMDLANQDNCNNHFHYILFWLELFIILLCGGRVVYATALCFLFFVKRFQSQPKKLANLSKVYAWNCIWAILYFSFTHIRNSSIVIDISKSTKIVIMADKRCRSTHAHTLWSTRWRCLWLI